MEKWIRTLITKLSGMGLQQTMDWMAVSSSILSVISGSRKECGEGSGWQTCKVCAQNHWCQPKGLRGLSGGVEQGKGCCLHLQAHLIVKITDVLVAFLLALVLLVLSQLCPQQLKLTRVSSARWRLKWPMV